MNKNTQLYLRIVLPAIIGLFYFYLASSNNLRELADKIATSTINVTNLSLSIFLFLLIGFIIHQYILPRMLERFWVDVDFNVKIKLANIAKLDDSDAYKLVCAKKRLMRVFFKLIDSDESLKNSSDKVRVNGLIITSLADIQLFSFLCIIALLFKIANTDNAIYWNIGVILFCLFGIIISDKLLQKHKLIHIEMGIDQLSELSAHHNKDVVAKIQELLTDIKSNGN